MIYIIAALAVYKLVQVADALTPREAMPWVKIVFSVVISYGIAAILKVDNLLIAGLAVATLAGSVHCLLRLGTLVGDMAQRKASR